MKVPLLFVVFLGTKVVYKIDDPWVNFEVRHLKLWVILGKKWKLRSLCLLAAGKLMGIWTNPLEGNYMVCTTICNSKQ